MALTEPTTLLARQAHVDGTWIDADSGATFDVANPATGETIASVPRCGVDDWLELKYVCLGL